MELIEDPIFPEIPVVYAKFDKRLGAIIIDWLILLVPTILFNSFLHGIGQLLVFIINWLYFAIMETGPRQATFGKRAYKIRVTNLAGGSLTFGQATGRFFGRIISTIILLLGYFMNLWDPKGQTLHDKMAGALVVENPKYEFL